MADEPRDTDQPEDVLDLTEQVTDTQPDDTGGDDTPPADDGGDELIVTLEGEDDDADQSTDNSTVRQMRQALREKDRRIKELESKNAPAAIEVGDKPTLETCDYDEARFEEELTAWHERKREADAQQEKTRAVEQEARAEFEEAGKRYQERKAALKLSDFDEREAAVEQALGPLSAVVAIAAKDPAIVVAALGKAPAKLAELQKIKNPFRLAGEIARIEAGVKTMPRKAPPAPDRPLSGSAQMPGTKDQQLAKLEKEAERTGNRTKLIAYRKQLKAQG